MSDQPNTPDEPEVETDPVVDQEAVASSTEDVEALAVAEQPVASDEGDDDATEEPTAGSEEIAGTAEDAPVAAATPATTTPKADRPPAPTRRTQRAPRAPGESAPVVRAHAKYVRTSARKARLVCDNIRGKSVEEARAILATTPRAVAEDWEKLLNSAVANAEHNHELVGDELKIHAVFADEGPTLKRFRPRAMGRATPIRKRTSHLTIQLTPQED